LSGFEFCCAAAKGSSAAVSFQIVSNAVTRDDSTMVRWIPKYAAGPIGVDISPRSVKVIQLNDRRTAVVDAVRWDVHAASEKESAHAAGPTREKTSDWDHHEHAAGQHKPQKTPVDTDRTASATEDRQIVAALRQALEGRRFCGRDAVLCLDTHDLMLANVRLAKQAGADMDRLVQQEAAARIPFAINEAEIRYLDGADVRQGDTMLREVTLLACHRPAIQRKIDLAEAAGLRPVAIDVAPTAVLRTYVSQYRRDEDRRRRAMFVHIGSSSTIVVIAQGADVLLARVLDVGGQHFDESVALHLDMSLADAISLRRYNGERRADQRDEDVAQSIADAARPVVERFLAELGKCVRYHSVTFRGQPLSGVVLSGGEANEALAEAIAARLDVKCEVGDPLRTLATTLPIWNRSQWDVAAGLALRTAR
jgi:type IV pilus assembly protein PilM